MVIIDECSQVIIPFINYETMFHIVNCSTVFFFKEFIIYSLDIIARYSNRMLCLLCNIFNYLFTCFMSILPCYHGLDEYICKALFYNHMPFPVINPYLIFKYEPSYISHLQKHKARGCFFLFWSYQGNYNIATSGSWIFREVLVHAHTHACAYTCIHTCVYYYTIGFFQFLLHIHTLAYTCIHTYVYYYTMGFFQFLLLKSICSVQSGQCYRRKKLMCCAVRLNSNSITLPSSSPNEHFSKLYSQADFLSPDALLRAVNNSLARFHAWLLV